MTGGSITNNTAQNGGGLYNLGQLNISSGEISSNNATNGGAVYYAGGVITNFAGINILLNTATNGGGLFIASPDANFFILSGGTIAENTADYGGGVFVQSGIFKMTGGVIGDYS
ncbi:MAG: hypothetical protein EOM15_16285, partial [Spirochaetia bacterium]|nr:hypothetical protein [Spirochaetia bacterium]